MGYKGWYAIKPNQPIKMKHAKSVQYSQLSNHHLLDILLLLTSLLLLDIMGSPQGVMAKMLNCNKHVPTPVIHLIVITLGKSIPLLLQVKCHNMKVDIPLNKETNTDITSSHGQQHVSLIYYDCYNVNFSPLS